MPQEADNISVNSSSSIDRVNIRTKPSKSPPVPPTSPSPQAIKNDLISASNVQMDSIDSLLGCQFRVKDSIPRSPAPMPESISPAGIAIDLADNDNKGDIVADSASNLNNYDDSLITNDLFKVELDLTIKGDKNSTSYRRNVKGSLIVIILLLISLHLFIEHLNMFTYVINFDYPVVVVATIFYVLSTLSVLLILTGTLMLPAMSIEEEKFKIFYGPFLVVGGLDLMGILVGGSVFGPFNIHTLDLDYSLTYTQIAALSTILVNSSLYYFFTRTSEDSPKIFQLFHPFEKVNSTETAAEIKQSLEHEPTKFEV